MRKGIIVLVALLALFASPSRPARRRRSWCSGRRCTRKCRRHRQRNEGLVHLPGDQAFEAANPGVKVQVVFQSADNYFELFKSTALAKQAPTSAATGRAQHQGLKDFILPLNKYFSKKEIDNFRVVLPSWKDYKVGGDFLAVPLAAHRRPVLQQGPLQEGRPAAETEFKDINDFMAACEKLKKRASTHRDRREGRLPVDLVRGEDVHGRLGPEFAYDASAGAGPSRIPPHRGLPKWNEVFKKGLLNPTSCP